MERILICYATHEGQTRKILEHMMVHAKESDIEWCKLGEEPSLPLGDYKKVLLGASIRYGHFPKALTLWVAKHKEELARVGAGFIGVCLTARKPEKNQPHTNLYMQKWLRRSPWQPAHCAVFAGALCYSRYNWWQTRIIQLIMWMTGGSRDTSQDLEFTDWQQVDRFAQRFLNDL